MQGNVVFKVYDVGEVSIVFAGIVIEGGFAEGEVITIVMEEDAFKVYKGADGSVTRSATHDMTALATLRIQQTSPLNKQLNALHQSDLNAPNGAGVGALEVCDLLGNSLHKATKCWIMKSPDGKYAREAGEREWKIYCADMVSESQGN